MIYLISDTEANSCKIGFSNEPFKRLQGLRTGNVGMLKMEGIIPGDMELERKLHEQFAKYRINGEWFLFCSEISDYFNCSQKCGFGEIEVYKKFMTALMKAKSPSAIKLLFLITDHLEFNKTKINMHYKDLNKLAHSLSIGRRTAEIAFKSLVEDGFIIRRARGEYHINPEMLFKGTNTNRLMLISSYITAEAKEKKYLSHNPIQKSDDSCDTKI